MKKRGRKREHKTPKKEGRDKEKGTTHLDQRGWWVVLGGFITTEHDRKERWEKGNSAKMPPKCGEEEDGKGSAKGKREA